MSLLNIAGSMACAAVSGFLFYKGSGSIEFGLGTFAGLTSLITVIATLGSKIIKALNR